MSILYWVKHVAHVRVASNKKELSVESLNYFECLVVGSRFTLTLQ